MDLLQSRSRRLGLSLLLITGLMLLGLASAGHVERLLHPLPVMAVLLGGASFYACTGLLRRVLTLEHEGWKRLILLATGLLSVAVGLFAAQFPLYDQEPLAALAVFIVAGLLAAMAVLIIGRGVLWVIDGFKQARGRASE